MIPISCRCISEYFRGNDNVKSNFEKYGRQYGQINLSIITYYEVLSGLRHRDAEKQLQSFLAFADQNKILNLTEYSVTTSAEIYAELRKEGEPIEDIDLLIAGIALSHDLMLATNNESHFSRIKGLRMANWSQKKL